MRSPSTTTSSTGPVAEAVVGPATDRVRAARIAGVGYVAIFALAIVANFLVVERLVVPGDAAATAANLADSLGLFRLGILAFLVVFVLDVIIAWALYVVLRPVQRDLALVAAWSRLVYTVLLGVALVFALQAVAMLGGGVDTSVLDPAQVEVQVALAMTAFDDAWLVGLAVFGVHLVLLGALLLRSGLAPRVLGVLLVVAGAAYAADTVAHILLPDYEAVAGIFLAVVAVPSVVGEGWLGLWLLLTKRLGR